jgi:hypothetical protein
MLISKGFKTYLMMRRNFRWSFPSPSKRTPSGAQSVLDGFYLWKYGEAYDSGSGLITFETAKGAVKGATADPTASQREDPEVAHFLKLNPDYRKGVELACMAEIRVSDFIGHFPKYFLPSLRKRPR